jgi:hypothetical protein
MSKAAELAALIGSGQAQGNKNIVTNGAMNISQRSTSVTGNTAGGYLTCDRINFVHNMGTWTVIQSSDAPSSEGFLNAYRIDCTTADTSVAATDYLLVQQKIEGQNLQTLRKGTSSAKSVTLSFFVKSNTTGNFVVELYDNDNARQISALYTISSANTWEKKTVTFAGDTSGAFDDDNAESLQINWWLGAGSNYTSGTLNTSWASATTANRVVGTQNLAASTDNDWAITGVQLEIGDVATAFEHEDIGTTLRKCQRYYAKSWSQGSAVTTNPGAITASNVGSVHRSFGNVFWPVTMRTAPTVTWYSGSTGTVNKWRNATSGTDITAASAVASIGESGYGFVLSAGIDAITDTLQGHYQAAAEL